MTTNPSHILIARNSRGQSNTSAPLSSPTETHAAAAGIFRSSAGSPPWFFEGVDTEDAVSDVSISDSQEPIDVDEPFTKSSKFPGTVKIVVESTTFWCVWSLLIQLVTSITDDQIFCRAHKEVLWFASPFFQAALSGNWAETGRPLSMSSVITISQTPTVPGDKVHPDAPTAITFAPMDPDLDPDELDIDLSETSEPEVIESSTSTVIASEGDNKETHGPGVESVIPSEAEVRKKAHEAARMESLEKLQRGASGNASAGSVESRNDPGKSIIKLSWKRGNAQVSARRHQMTSNPDAVIALKEEKVWFFAACLQTSSHRRLQASTFHDFLRFVYPGYAFVAMKQKGHTVLTCGAAWSAQSHGTTWRDS